MTIKLISFGFTDVGKQRDHNEDAFHIDPEEGLYLLCDGMGGHASGQVASKMAIEAISEFVRQTRKAEKFEWPFEIDETLSFNENSLANGIKVANQQIFDKSQTTAECKGMGTTSVAILNNNESLILAHVGDSRIYRYREGSIEQMTEDHSLLNHLKKTKGLTQKEIDNFPNKNVIIRAVGLKEYTEVDLQVEKKQFGDIYLMCSDGLCDMMEDWVMANILSANENNLQEAVHSLINLANDNGGKDNVTVILVKCVLEI